MESQLLCIGIGLIVGFVVGLLARLMFKKNSDILSCLVEFVIYGKKRGESNEIIQLAIKKMLDILLKGYDDFQRDPVGMQKKMREEGKQDKEIKAMIIACNKLIKETKKIINKLTS